MSLLAHRQHSSSAKACGLAKCYVWEAEVGHRMQQVCTKCVVCAGAQARLLKVTRQQPLSRSCPMPDGATTTDGRSCSGPFWRPLRLEDLPSRIDASSLGTFKAPTWSLLSLLATKLVPLTLGFTQPMCHTGFTCHLLLQPLLAS